MLAFLWALIVLLYWQTYSYIKMRQNLFLKKLLRDNNQKQKAVSFKHSDISMCPINQQSSFSQLCSLDISR
jgi:hypothetical protein